MGNRVAKDIYRQIQSRKRGLEIIKNQIAELEEKLEYVLANPAEFEDVYLKKEDLLEGEIYECDGRNFTYGIWNGEAFDYLRTKFGQKFFDVEYHWDDGAPYGTVKPIRLMEFD